MQKWTPNVASIIEHAKNIYPEQEVVSRMVSGEIHKTNYKEVCIRSRKLASALEKDGYKKGDVLALIGDNKPEWVFFEIACHANGGMSLGVYRDTLDDEVGYLVKSAKRGKIKIFPHFEGLFHTGKHTFPL